MVIPQDAEKPGIGMERINRHMLEEVGCKGFLDKVVTADPGAVFQNTMKDMT